MNCVANIRNFCEKKAVRCIFLAEMPEICSTLQIHIGILVKIKTQMQRHLANYQYLCTHETVYEKTLPTHLVGPRNDHFMGMRILAVHPLRHHLVSTDHLYLVLRDRGVHQYDIRSPAAPSPLHAHR